MLLFFFLSSTLIAQCDTNSTAFEHIIQNHASLIETPANYRDSAYLSKINPDRFQNLPTEKDSFLIFQSSIQTIVNTVVEDSLLLEEIDNISYALHIPYKFELGCYNYYHLCSQIVDEYYCERSKATRLLIKYCVLYRSGYIFRLVWYNGDLCLGAYGDRFIKTPLPYHHRKDEYFIVLEVAQSHPPDNVCMTLPAEVKAWNTKYARFPDLNRGIRNRLPSYMGKRGTTSKLSTEGLKRNFKYETSDAYVAYFESLPVYTGAGCYSTSKMEFSPALQKSFLRPLKRRLWWKWSIKKKITFLQHFIDKNIALKFNVSPGMQHTQFAEQTLRYKRGDVSDCTILLAALIEHTLHKKCVYIDIGVSEKISYLGVKWNNAPSEYPRVSYEQDAYVVLNPISSYTKENIIEKQNLWKEYKVENIWHLFGTEWSTWRQRRRASKKRERIAKRKKRKEK